MVDGSELQKGTDRHLSSVSMLSQAPRQRRSRLRRLFAPAWKPLACRGRIGLSASVILGFACCWSLASIGSVFCGESWQRHDHLQMRHFWKPVGATTMRAKRALKVRKKRDTFDPWTVLDLPFNATADDARVKYKALIRKYHPDRNPSPDAQKKVDSIVRAYDILSGEDTELDQAALLKNAIFNLKQDIDGKKIRLDKLLEEEAEAAVDGMQTRNARLAEVRQALQEEIDKAEVQLKEARSQREGLTQQLGALGGAAIGLLTAGPPGAVVGAAAGMMLNDRDDAIGQVIRGSGQVVKGVSDGLAPFMQEIFKIFTQRLLQQDSTTSTTRPANK
eukprot:TRINITY_DN36557_c0_g1_i1.p1 TRINITY_DN36557_c0_g1~~TRINITY_DN36557_c0_g1_i1.p1  ORF type:complete len:333 (+),score=64.77 TRINITY_DN36557_c0_g1_i1:100-1098(+)